MPTAHFECNFIGKDLRMNLSKSDSYYKRDLIKMFFATFIGCH